MLDLREAWLLEVFVAVVETGSMSAAAKSKHIATATVSDSISRLESLVGGEKLLYRNSSGSLPTDRGQEVLQVAYQLIADVGGHLDVINRCAARDFRVGSTFGIHNSHMTKLSELSNVKMHGVSISIRDPGRDIVDNTVDAGLLMGPTRHDQSLWRYYAFTEPRVAVFSRHLANGHRDGVSLDFLDQLTWPSLPADADRNYLLPWICADVRRGPPAKQGAAVADLMAIRDWMESARMHDMVIATTPRLARSFANFEGLITLPIEDVSGWDVDVVAKPANAERAQALARLLRQHPPRDTYVDESKLPASD